MQDEAAEKLKQERLAAYAAKKAKSMIRNCCVLYLATFCTIIEPAVVAKSNIILDVKPWDDETGRVNQCGLCETKKVLVTEELAI